MAIVITLLLMGVILLLAETVLPGLIAGIVGLICLIAGVVAGYQEFGVTTGNLLLLGVILGMVLGIYCWLKYFPESRMAALFTSRGTVGELRVEKPELLDQTGTAHTQLRPSGTAIINGQRVDVVTEGGHIERGTAVKVIAVEGLRVVVRKL